MHILKLISTLFVFSGLIGCVSLPSRYSADSIEMWVVNAETKQPMEDVIVVANWALRGGWEDHETGSLHLVETVTDKDGRFFIPAWGPKRRPVDTSMEMNSDPKVLLFKPGYSWRRLQSNPLGYKSEAKVRPFELNGQTVEMERFIGTPDEYRNHLYTYETVLHYPTYTSDCIWKKMPRATIAIKRQKLEIVRRIKGQSAEVPNHELLRSLMRTLTKSDGSDPCNAGEFLQEFV